MARYYTVPQVKLDELRALYDRGVRKATAGRITGLAEATVYRYYAKWDAITSITLFDLAHLSDDVLDAYKHQARIRGLSLYQCVHTVLRTVATDNLFDALLNISDDNPVKGRLNGES